MKQIAGRSEGFILSVETAEHLQRTLLLIPFRYVTMLCRFTDIEDAQRTFEAPHEDEIRGRG